MVVFDGINFILFYSILFYFILFSLEEGSMGIIEEALLGNLGNMEGSHINMLNLWPAELWFRLL